jgi:hypothetical protein
VWRFLITVAFSCFVFPVVCPLKYLHIERYLAAKTGTNFTTFDWIGLLFIDDLYLEWCYYSCSYW